MKKASLALTTLAALTVTTVALAEGPRDSGRPTSTLPTPSTLPGQPAPPPPSPAPQVVTTTTITADEVMPQSTTIVTSAEAPPPPPEVPPAPRDTIVVKQSYRPNRPLLYTGALMLVGSYATTAAMTSVKDIRDDRGDQMLYVPVAGPWLHLMNSTPSNLDTALIIGSGVVQDVGLAIGLLSLIVPEHVPAATIQAGAVHIQVTGTSYGRGSAGIGALGTF